MSETRPAISLRVIAALTAARIVLVLGTRDSSWGVHRDEFLYLAMADHLELFRMQFPPLIAVVAAIGHAVFGDSVLAARVPAAVAGAALAGVVLLIVRRLGGGVWACLLAWLAMLAAPLFVRTSLLMQPVVFDLLWSTIAIGALTVAAHEDAPRWWIAVGVALGLGALTKFSIAFVGASVAVATVLTPVLRAQLKQRWPWYAVLIGAVMSVPSVAGQFAHNWPFLQQMQALRGNQLDRVTPFAFAAGQLQMIAGAMCCVVPALASAFRGGARERVPVIAALSMLTLMLVMHGKPYYAGPAYPVLVATGALSVERVLRDRLILTLALSSIMMVGAIALWPIGIPSLSPAAMKRYTSTLGIAETVTTNAGVVIELPQDYADMLGWREIADTVGAIASRLPADERADLTLIGGNYGEAGALAFYRERAKLPYAVSTSGDFWAWGPGVASGANVLVVADASAGTSLSQMCESVRVMRELTNPLLVPEEQHVVIYYAQRPRRPLSALWPTLGPNW